MKRIVFGAVMFVLGAASVAGVSRAVSPGEPQTKDEARTLKLLCERFDGATTPKRLWETALGKEQTETARNLYAFSMGLRAVFCEAPVVGKKVTSAPSAEGSAVLPPSFQ